MAHIRQDEQVHRRSHRLVTDPFVVFPPASLPFMAAAAPPAEAAGSKFWEAICQLWAAHKQKSSMWIGQGNLAKSQLEM